MQPRAGEHSEPVGNRARVGRYSLRAIPPPPPSSRARLQTSPTFRRSDQRRFSEAQPRIAHDCGATRVVGRATVGAVNREELFEFLRRAVVIESTDAGCERTLFSLTRAAAVTCGIMNPEFRPALGARNGGRPSLSAGLTRRSILRSEMPASAVRAIAKKSKAKAIGSP